VWEAKNEVDEDIMCDVCMDDYADEDENGDIIVICDFCNSAVHQSCYGKEIKNCFPKDKDWFCQRCVFLMQTPASIVPDTKCYFCNDLKGIMVKTNQCGFAHISCINWIPEIWFEDTEREQIGGSISSDRFKLFCYICKVRNSGACI
jgi:hypothetical protein